MLPPALREAVAKAGWQSPSAVQAAALPHALAGKDVIAQAMTGSGKTAAFALPLLSKLIHSGGAAQLAQGTEDPLAAKLRMALEKGRAGPTALVLCPTVTSTGEHGSLAQSASGLPRPSVYHCRLSPLHKRIGQTQSL